MTKAATALKRIFINKKGETDMTEGSILRHLIAFAFPLLIGNIFQMLYNMVDTWVVGNYVENTAAFDAVGSVGPMINMLIGFFSGLASGAGVVISQYFGAGKEDRVRDTVHTAISITAIMSVLFTVLGICLIPTFLTISNTPAHVAPESTTYLTIYFAGITGLLLYNMGAGILRAVGDSTKPFLFLVVSAVINTVLDLWFVIGLDLGVAGVAYATIIAQAVSAVLVMIALIRTRSCVRFSIRSLCIKGDILKKIFRVGLPAAIQMAITSFSNIFVQSYINGIDNGAAMGGWTAYGKIDQVLLLPMQSLALASTTFLGQNLGKGQVDRAKAGLRMALLMSVICAVALMIPVMIFAPYLVAFFSEASVAYGTIFLRWISPFYVLCCFNQIYAGGLRGAGNSRAPMIIMLSSFVVYRQVYLFVVANFISNTVIPIAMSYPTGWMLASLLTWLYYRRVDLGKNRLIE